MRKIEKKYQKNHNFFLLRRHFDDFDDFASSAREWTLGFRQLDRGLFHGDIFQFKQGPILLSRFSVNRRLELCAAPPEGFRNFGIPVKFPQPLVWRGRVLQQPTIQVYQSHDDFEAVTPPNFTTFTLSISEDVLGELGQMLRLPVPWELPGRPDVVSGDPVALQDFHQTLQQVNSLLTKDPSEQENPWLRHELEFEIPQQLLSLLSTVEPVKTRPSPKQKTRALTHAVAYIREHYTADPLTVQALYQAAGVSKRTLEYAFLEHFGVSPKTYLQVYRLNQVRKAFKKSDPDSTKIADVANRWGFWHMGHFANDYHKLFGELPSETLKHSTRKKGNRLQFCPVAEGTTS